MGKRKKTPDERDARLDEHRRRFHEVAQRAVDEHNARLSPGAEPWPDRVPPPGRDATPAQRTAWNAQLEWDIRLLRGLAEKAQAELDRKKRESDAA
jgi:hypothetical protein